MNRPPELTATPSPADTARQWAPVLKALGDPVRLEIVLLLAERSRSVKDLQAELRLSQALVSHHLRLLREQGMVTSTTQGRSNIYEIRMQPLACLTDCLAALVAPTGSCLCVTTGLARVGQAAQ
jgi:DNA-binding transcriptional ArsR family regulator